MYLINWIFLLAIHNRSFQKAITYFDDNYFDNSTFTMIMIGIFIT